MGIFSLFFSFKGRITRGQYWLAGVGQTIALALLIVMVLETLGMSPEEVRAGRAAANPDVLARVGAAGLALLFGFAVLAWTGAAIYTKRLHDRNKGAIWLLAIYVPAFLPLLALTFGADAFVVAGFVAFLSSLWVFIELGCLRGTDGPNRFDHGMGKSAYLDDVFGSANNAKPSAPNGLGGMEAAMAAVNAAARANPAPLAQLRANTPAAPQFGQRAPTQFGRLGAAPSSGGFGRKV
jgi:uncharacterized membrane protein YhaH (DUF805 family)